MARWPGGPVDLGENNFLETPLVAGNLDDGTVEVDITTVFPDGLNFFDVSYDSIFINSNGLITFEGPNTTFDAPELSTLDEPALAPFFTDINVSGGDPAGSNNIYWDLDPDNGTVTITYFEVESFNSTGTNTFQVVLTNAGDGTVGIEYIYENIDFTNGFVSEAQVGITDGGSNDIIVPGSGDAEALLNFPNSVLILTAPPVLSIFL